MTLFVILPALNEAAALSRLVPDIARVLQTQPAPFKIGVIDDGSTDETSQVVQGFPADMHAQLLRHEMNRGYGASLATGFEWVLREAKPEDAVVSLDSDNTHLPMYIPLLVKKLDEGYAVVTASYRAPGGQTYGVPLSRLLLSAGINGLFKMISPVPGIRTYTNGFRAYRVSALRQAAQAFGPQWIQEPGFAGGTELFLKVCRPGVRAAEIPFELHYENRGGLSKIRIGRTILGYLHLLRQARHFGAPQASKPVAEAPSDVIQ